MIAIKKGTTNWRATEKLGPDEVEFKDEFLYEANNLTPAMVWDDKLGNVRPKNDADRAAEGVENESRLQAQAQSILDGTDQSTPLHVAIAELMRKHVEVETLLATKADK